MDVFAHDLRYALRSLRRAPAFAALVIGTLAVGIGANATIFSVVDAVFFRPFPYAAPDRLVQVFESVRDNPAQYGNVSFPNFNDWRAATRTLSGLVAVSGGGANLTSNGPAERVSTIAASANLFDVLGVRPILGRGFSAGDDGRGAARVAVLSEGFWRRRFGGDPSVVGRVVDLDGAPTTIVGVMPGDFATGRSPDLWLPLDTTPRLLAVRGFRFLDVYARLAPGATIGQAGIEMRQIASRLEKQYPDDNANHSIRLIPLRDAVTGAVREPIVILLGAVALVLVVACANVASLLLARAATRQHDVAVRLALGAGRARLTQQFLTEAIMLALAGAALGTAGAWAVLRVAGSVGARFLPIPGAIPLDGRVLLVLLGVSIVSGVLFGLAPALRGTSAPLRDALAGAGKTTAGAARQRSRSALVVTQIALSVVLLVGAGLLLRTFLVLVHTTTGLDANGVVTTRLSVAHAADSTPAIRADRVFEPLLDRLRATPGITAAGVTTLIPLQRWGTAGTYWVAERPRPAAGHEPGAEFRVVSPGYFAALGIPLRRGRDFTDADHTTADEPIIVNETFARRALPNEDPIGKRIALDTNLVFTIVGVAGDVRQAGLASPPLAEIYFTYRSRFTSWGIPAALIVRSRLSTTSAVAAVRGAAAQIAPDVPVYQVSTMDEIIGNSLGERRLNLWLIGGFAVITLVLAAAGLYGVVAYTVAQRTREVGIRMALGARRLDIVRLMLGYGAARATIGIAAGLSAAVVATRVLSNMLVGIRPDDPLTYAGVAALLGVTALTASWIPARRASRVDPMVAIRAE
jgi:predicted permease